MNPELRQTLNALSHNFETANQAAQENIYTFAQLYIDPCLTGFKACLYDCTAPCFPNWEDNLRRKRGRSRGRAEYSFDFYDDWDDEEGDANGALSWGNGELDSLLAGHGSLSGQPKRQRAMSYGSRGRKRTILQGDSDQDRTVIPGSSYLGFLERLPFGLGNRVLRYQPSAADLQVNPGGLRPKDRAESEPLIEESPPRKIGHARNRSGTTNSRSTTNSLSSRGDLIMSDEEDDAVPLDDEFATAMLSRRMTNTTEDHSSGKTGSSGRPGVSRRSTRTVSGKSTRSSRKSSQRSSSAKSIGLLSPDLAEQQGEQPQPRTPTIMDLKQEEDQVREEEEMEIQQKREAAQRLAVSRGLSSTELRRKAEDAKTATKEIKSNPYFDQEPELELEPRPADEESQEAEPAATEIRAQETPAPSTNQIRPDEAGAVSNQDTDQDQRPQKHDRDEPP